MTVGELRKKLAEYHKNLVVEVENSDKQRGGIRQPPLDSEGNILEVRVKPGQIVVIVID